MKQILIFIVAAFITTNANAQWFLGGNVGLSVNDITENRDRENNDEHRTLKTSGFSFAIAPKSGYYFNEKFALGLSLNFQVGTSLRIDSWSIPVDGLRLEDESKSQRRSMHYGIYPFVRYSILTYKKLSIIMEGTVGVAYKQGKDVLTMKSSDAKSEIRSSTIGITVLNVTPIIGFNLSKHFQLEARLNLFSLGYSIDITKGETKGNADFFIDTQNYNNVAHNFTTGFNAANILSMSGFTIGFIYKF